jgi:hypothetical protein
MAAACPMGAGRASPHSTCLQTLLCCTAAAVNKSTRNNFLVSTHVEICTGLQDYLAHCAADAHVQPVPRPHHCACALAVPSASQPLHLCLGCPVCTPAIVPAPLLDCALVMQGCGRSHPCPTCAASPPLHLHLDCPICLLHNMPAPCLDCAHLLCGATATVGLRLAHAVFQPLCLHLNSPPRCVSAAELAHVVWGPGPVCLRPARSVFCHCTYLLAVPCPQPGFGACTCCMGPWPSPAASNPCHLPCPHSSVDFF